VVPGAPETKGAPPAAKVETPRAEPPVKSDVAPARIEGGKIVDAPARAETAKPIIAAAPATKAAEPPPGYDTEAAPPKKSAPEPVAKPATKPAPPIANPPAKAAPVPTEKPKVAEAKSDTGSSAGFVVQVAALNDVEKAKQMLGQIAAAGIKSYSEIVPTAKGNVTRVRAGPFATREEAEKMRDKLKGMGLSGNIVPK
jgi:DedD protein